MLLINTYSAEQLLSLAGDNHKYQKIITTIAGLQWLISGCMLLTPQILYQPPILTCQSTTGGPPFPCDESLGCKQEHVQIFDPTFNTISGQFQLYCDRKYLRAFASTSVYLGGVLGAFCLSYIADHYGRMRVKVYAWLVLSIVLLLQYLIVELYAQLFFTFLTGGLIFGITNLDFTYINESSAQNIRSILILILMMFFPAGGIIFTYGSKYLRDWRLTYLYCITIPALIMNIPSFILYEESPYFLMATNQHKRLKKTIDRIASINARSHLIPFSYDIQNESKDDSKDDNSDEQQTYSFIDLFRYKSLRRMITGCCVSFFAIQNIYFGINFSTDQFGFDIYTNNLFSELGEVAGYILFFFVVKKALRKKCSLIGFFVLSVICFLFVFLTIPEDCTSSDVFCYQKVIQLGLATIAKLIVAVVFSLVQIYYSEMFPTLVRSQALGLTMSVGCMGILFVPFMKDYAIHIGVTPLLFVSAIGFLGIIGLSMLEETLNVPMPDEIYETTIQYQQICLKNVNDSTINQIQN